MPTRSQCGVLAISSGNICGIRGARLTRSPAINAGPRIRTIWDPETSAQHHLEAEQFCKMLSSQGVKADLVLFDPPYSPRQIAECYKQVGREVGVKETQNAALYKRVRDAVMPLLAENAVVLSFGWNSAGMGTKRGFEQVELLLVAHGGGHNDTICVAERRLPTLL